MQDQARHLLDDAFARIEGAARDAATSPHNDRPYPTEAQAVAGNYRHGWTTLHGLTIKIENVRNSIRSGTSEDGKKWSNRMACHYGEIVGTRGADGDPIDVFVGAFPESPQVWVINQGWPDGAFDEHKVVIGAGSERMARDLYLASFDLGWQGLQSMHPATIAQLKWWLRNGDLTQPFTPQQLPLLDGAQTIMDKTLWTAQAEPVGKTLPALMYELRVDDADGLLLDSAVLGEFVADVLTEEGACLAPKPMLDALVIPVARMSLRMEQLMRVMNAAGGELSVSDFTIADPIKARGVLQVAVMFALSDGQAITVWFHNPDSTPAKLTPLDELVSWKWMLNKKDITVVVAPERGRELNPREVGRRVMKLAERNSAKFAEANKALAEKTATIAALNEEIPVLEARLAEVQGQVDAARAAKEQAAAEAEAAANDPQAQERYILTAEGYASIRNDEVALLKWQDVLDSHFQGRLIAFRNALRDLGWEGEAYKPLTKGDVTLALLPAHVGAGRNIAGLTYFGELGAGVGNGNIAKAVDDLVLTPEALAAKFNSDVDEALARRAARIAAQDLAEADAIKARDAGIDGFLNTLPDERTRVRARQTLNKLVRSGGSPVVLKDFIIKRIEAGYVAANDGMYGPILRSPDGAFVEQSKITKFGMDFARYLIAKRDVDADEAAADEMSMGPDRTGEPGATIGALSDALSLLNWKIRPVRKGFSAESARGTEVVVEPDFEYPNAIEIHGSNITLLAGGDAKRAADQIDLEDYGLSLNRENDGERIEDEADPFNGLKLEFVRAIERVEQGAASAGMQVVWGNFDDSLHNAALFDAVSQAAEDAARPGVVSAQIGRVGMVIARASIDEDGIVTLYAGASGAEPSGTDSTWQGIAASLKVIEAGRTSTIEPEPKPQSAVFHAQVSAALLAAGWKVESTTKAEDSNARIVKSVMKAFAGMAEPSKVFPNGERSASVVWIKDFSKVRIEFNWDDTQEVMVPNGDDDAAAFAAAIDARVTGAAKTWQQANAKPARSGSAAEQAAADTALAMAAGVVAELGGTFAADGFSGPGTAGAWSYGNAQINGKTLRLAGSGGGVVQVDGKPFDPAGVVMTTADQVRAAILAVAPAEKPEPAGDPARTDAGEKWTRSTTADRTAWLIRAGYGFDGKLTLSAQTILNKAWADMRQVVKDKLIAAADAPRAGDGQADHDDQLFDIGEQIRKADGAEEVRAILLKAKGMGRDFVVAALDSLMAYNPPVFSILFQTGDSMGAMMSIDKAADAVMAGKLEKQEAAVPTAAGEGAKVKQWRAEADAYGAAKQGYIGSRDYSAPAADLVDAPLGSWALTSPSGDASTFEALFPTGEGTYASGGVMATPALAYESMTKLGRWVMLQSEIAAAQREGGDPADKLASGTFVSDSPERAADTAYLNSLIDGTGDLLAADTFERLEPMFTTYADNAEMMALLERAATVYGDAAQAAARQALAPA